MAEIVQTMKLLIQPTAEEAALFQGLTKQYAAACNVVSEYIFNHNFLLDRTTLHSALYYQIIESFGLKSQFSCSVLSTVIASYTTVKTQLEKNPFKYQYEDGTWEIVDRTLEWLRKPICFQRPQADLVRGHDYSFLYNKKTGEKRLSINTLRKGRVKVPYVVPKNFQKYFDGTWKFGVGKLVKMKGKWYFHISMSKNVPDSTAKTKPSNVVGIDRGLRFLATTYDDKGKTTFFSGKQIMQKRERFADVRAELQSKGTKSTKRVLKRISGRENRWMSDVNHQISKTLVDSYGENTLFVIEDLTDVSFDKRNLNRRSDDNRELSSWAFYQLELFLTYKATAKKSSVHKVNAFCTSQRCPKCGRIRKENRHHDIHEYICDCCGYRSSDDRVGAMNIWKLGEMYISGDQDPSYAPKNK